jgi:hypothetical protein
MGRKSSSSTTSTAATHIDESGNSCIHSSKRFTSNIYDSKQQIQNCSSKKTYDEILIPLLAQRSFHLPNNTWKEDWIQWMKNNHIILGICFHHPLHPIETWERFIVLAGSIGFALVATNIAYIWDWYDGNEYEFNPNYVVYTFTFGDDNDDENGDDNIDDSISNGIAGINEINITYGMLILWTFGCTFHSIFDIVVWNLSACACCHPGGRYGTTSIAKKCHDFGSFVLIPFVLAVLVLAGYSSYLRIINSNTELTNVYEDDIVDSITNGKLGKFTFFLKFSIELLLAWFIFFPCISTLFFSGLLGCKTLPLLGGRPRDKKILLEQLEKEELELELAEMNVNTAASGSGSKPGPGPVRHSYTRF